MCTPLIFLVPGVHLQAGGDGGARAHGLPPGQRFRGAPRGPASRAARREQGRRRAEIRVQVTQSRPGAF